MADTLSRSRDALQQPQLPASTVWAIALTVVIGLVCSTWLWTLSSVMPTSRIDPEHVGNCVVTSGMTYAECYLELTR